MAGLRQTVSVLVLAWGTAMLAPAADDVATGRRVDRIIGAMHSLRSQFEQTLAGAHGEVLERASGTLYLAKPNRFRWDYATGVHQLIVSDGERVWLYDQELEQVTVRTFGQSLSATPAGLLAGTGQVSESFRVADLGRYDGLDWVRLQPKTTDTDFREIRLGLAGDQLVRMTLKDKLGQSTDLSFTSVESNPPLDATLFQFTPPPGVDVIGKPGP